MLYTGTLLRAEIYDDHIKPYTNVKAVYEAHKGKYPGKLIVTNGHWYNTKPVTPCGNYKVNGTVLSTEEWMDWGFGWDTGPIITMRSTIPVMVTDMSNDNYLSTLPLLVGGKKRDDVIKKQKPNVKVPTLRTWFGVDAKGKWTVEVTTTNYTLDGIVESSLRKAAMWDELKDRLNKSALGLSGGQQQRLCIARALAADPAILLMDEPTSALDPISTGKIEELCDELKKSVTIVIVTHNMQQAARISDKTAFFLLGEVIEYGETQQIFSAPVKAETERYISGRFG